MTAQLRKALTLVSGMIQRGQRRPILEAVLISPHGFRCSHLDDGDLVVPFDTGVAAPVAVNAAALKKAVAKGDATLTSEGENIRVTLPSGSLVVPGLPADEFPIRDDEMGHINVPLGRSELSVALKRTMVAATKDATRFQMHSVLFERKDGKLRLVATDGKRMTVETLFSPGEDFTIIVPLRSAKLLAKLVSGKGDDIVLSVRPDEFLCFEGLRAKAVQGRYPEYERAMPSDVQGAFDVDVDSLRSAMEIAGAGCTPGQPAVRCEFADGKLVATSGSKVQKDGARAEISARAPRRSLIEQVLLSDVVHMNPEYLVALCKSCGESTLTIGITNRKTAVLFSAGTFQHIVMPLIVQEE